MSSLDAARCDDFFCFRFPAKKDVFFVPRPTFQESQTQVANH